MSYGPNYNSADEPVCRYCGQVLDENDDEAMDSGYCCEEHHMAGKDEEENREYEDGEFNPDQE